MGWKEIVKTAHAVVVRDAVARAANGVEHPISMTAATECALCSTVGALIPLLWPPISAMRWTWGGKRLVMLDTLMPGSHSGHCLPVVLDWLEAELARYPVPTLLFMHHPPFLSGLGMMDEVFEGVERLHAILATAPYVRLCCGHMHRPIVSQWAGCLALTAPSIAMQIELDLSLEA